MALILNIETSTKNCSVSIAKDAELLVLCEEATDGYQHAEKLHTFIAWAMEAEDIRYQDFDAICVGKGPGSYTGLRIGVSAAKGLCFALDIPLISINSLEILANSVRNQADIIIPMTDARRKEVYTAVFDKNIHKIQSTYAKILDKKSFSEFNNDSIMIVGDGAEKAKEILKLSNAVYDLKKLPSAQYMCEKAALLYQQKIWEDVAYFEPFYLKDFVAG